MLLDFDARLCQNLGEASQREWLETNGLGGYASGTVAGLHTRRYHGLLVAALRPPVARTLLLSKFEETLIVDGERFELSVNRYPDAIHPQGHRLLQRFHIDPFPVWTFLTCGVKLHKCVFMPHGENTVVVEYAIEGGLAQLELRPLIAFRDYHATTHCNDALRPQLGISAGLVRIEPYAGLPPLHLAHNAAAVESGAGWYFRFQYEREKERGLDFEEDLFNACALRFELAEDTPARVIASTDVCDMRSVDQRRVAEQERRRQIAARSPSTNALAISLTAAADHYVVRRGDFHTIIAGYHWFADWGRDTMIALPGLTLATKRYDAAKDILFAFTGYLSEGMLPNRFPDAGENPEYNTVDATLWYFEAIRALAGYTGDAACVREHFYEHLKSIIEWHRRGTRYGIKVDDDGLLKAGEPGVQLTWMDARVGDRVVTPRNGKAVEIQALWYNALRITAAFAKRFGDTTAALALEESASIAAGSFNEKFWNAEAGCLYDVVDSLDASIRPNQLIAASLHYTMLNRERILSVVRVAERDLLTPMGLRTLSPSDPAYKPRYEGGVNERDSAYHQGAVWPWLIGPFVTAYLRAHGHSWDARQQALRWLKPFEAALTTSGLGHIGEIADGGPPHDQRGCIAQAWSVAEALRALLAALAERPSGVYDQQGAHIALR